MDNAQSTAAGGRVPAILVAGAGGGIGFAVARALAEAGVPLHLGLHRESPELRQWAATAGSADVSVGLLDAADVTSTGNWVHAGVARHGGVQALVSCVGTTYPPMRFLDQSPSEWADLLRSDLISALTLVHAAAPALIRNGSGRIVLLSSDSARAGAAGQAVSSAARGGVNAFSRAMARELARAGITVNTVCPGPVEGGALDDLMAADSGIIRATIKAIPIGRAARPAEVAAVFRFLVLADCGAITGQAIGINGGLTMG